MTNYPFTGPTLLVHCPYTNQYITTTGERLWLAMYKANEALQGLCEIELNYILTILGGQPTEDGKYLKWYFGNYDINNGYTWITPMPNIVRQTNGVSEAIELYYRQEPIDERKILQRV